MEALEKRNKFYGSKLKQNTNEATEPLLVKLEPNQVNDNTWNMNNNEMSLRSRITRKLQNCNKFMIIISIFVVCIYSFLVYSIFVKF